MSPDLNLLLSPAHRLLRRHWQRGIRGAFAQGVLEGLLNQVVPAHEPSAVVV